MIDLSGAKLVIDPVRRVRIGAREVVSGGERLKLDIGKQTKADVSFLLRAISLGEIEKQVRLDNEPSRILVDGRPTKPLEAVTRRVDVQFGNEFEVAAVLAVEKRLRQAIKRFLPRRVEAATWRFWREWGREGLDNIQSNWHWEYRGPDDARFKHISRQAIRKLRVPPGGKLILVPNNDAAVGFLNHIAKSWGRKITTRRGPNAGAVRYDRTKGFMAYSIYGLKRSRALRQFTIYVTHTKTNQTAGDARAAREKLWSHGTPYITILARMRSNKRGTYRAYQRY